MRQLLVLIVVGCLFAAGCSMAAPGVARVQAPQAPGEPVVKGDPALSGDKSWGNEKVSSIEPVENQTLSTDFSKRDKLGVRYFGDKDMSGKAGKPMPYQSAAEARQAARREARMAEWKARSGVGPSNPAKQ